MRIRPLLIAMSALVASSLVGEGDIKWEYKPTDAKIQLVMADDTRVVVKATPTKPVNAKSGNSSRALYFGIPGDTSDKQVIGSPIFIDLGPINPWDLAHPVNIVKLEKKAGTRNWAMKAIGSDFFPSPESEVIPLNRRPRPVQDVDGNLTLSLPVPLPPGEYAVFTDVEAWAFTVKSADR